MTHVDDIVFPHQIRGRCFINIVTIEANIRGKPRSMWNLIETDIQTVELSSLCMLASEVKQPDSYDLLLALLSEN